MKAFIIYIAGNEKSEQYANQALQSFDGKNGWKPKLFLGVTPDTLFEYEEQCPLKIRQESRAMDFFNGDRKRYIVKKCCSYNHYRLFRKCVELNEPIAIIEHDAHCIGDWNNVEFSDILVMNAESAIKQEVFEPIWNLNSTPIQTGVRDINFKGLNYRHDPVLSSAHMMPGTASYAITPSGAEKMIQAYEQDGWEQSDFIINTWYVKIQTIMPELFTFKLPNLEMSHGENMK